MSNSVHLFILHFSLAQNTWTTMLDSILPVYTHVYYYINYIHMGICKIL